MTVVIDELATNVEIEPPQSMASDERTPPDVAPLSPKEVLRLVEQRRERDLRMRAH